MIISTIIVTQSQKPKYIRSLIIVKRLHEKTGDNIFKWQPSSVVFTAKSTAIKLIPFLSQKPRTQNKGLQGL